MSRKFPSVRQGRGSATSEDASHGSGADDKYDPLTRKEIPGYQGDVMGISYLTVKTTLEHQCKILYKLDICEGKHKSGKSKCCPGGIRWFGYGTPTKDPNSPKPYDPGNTFEGGITGPGVVPGSVEHYMGSTAPVNSPR